MSNVLKQPEFEQADSGKIEKYLLANYLKQLSELHLAVILDGNRRYAKKQSLISWQGHQFGAKNVENLLKWLYELKIKELTMYAFSMQNFNREEIEVSKLFSLFIEFFSNKKIIEACKKNSVRIKFVGRIHLFPENMQKIMRDLEAKTVEHNKHFVNFAMAYGGREEMVDATKKIAELVKSGKLGLDEIDEELVSKNLYLSSEPEIVIRTGGDCRTSNFLIWQSNYSEWFFLEKTWPEFDKSDLLNVLRKFFVRERRFGK